MVAAVAGLAVADPARGPHPAGPGTHPRPARPPKSPPLTRAGCWQLYGRATEQLAPGTFRSKTHYKECLKGLRQQQKVWTYRDAKVGRGAKSRDILAVNANVDNRRWAGLERRLGQLREREARGL